MELAKWIKLGPLWEPPGPLNWATSHAALPALDPIDDHRAWLYFSSRDADGHSHIGRAEVGIGEGEISVRRFDSNTVLSPGALGSFDDQGVTNSWVLAEGDCRLLYYSGWSLGVTVPFYFYVGLAVSEDGGATFHRVSEAPILERDSVDPFLTASPCVLRDGDRYRMWYVSATGWELVEGQPRHHYHVKYAESSDGIAWERAGQVSIDYAAPSEYAISRPCVVRDSGGYRMWFSARGDRYRLGYAESDDGMNWSRRDELAGLVPSAGGWDSDMVAYPFVHRQGRYVYMLYNGNDYGRAGIGYAVSEQE